MKLSLWKLNKNYMNQSYFLGVDISKSKMDCILLNAELKPLTEKVVVNTESHIRAFLGAVLKKHKIEMNQLLICCENTGIYNRPLERICNKLNLNLWVEHALKIKRASTDMRGKNDQKDALRIAEYSFRYRDKQVIYKEPDLCMREMNLQLKVRDTLLKQRVEIENQLREAQTHDEELFKGLVNGYKKVLKELEASILKAEDKLKQLYRSDKKIVSNVELLKTIPGIGLIAAVNLIITTNNFQQFENAKHLACYAGVVPFQNQSGTIIKRDRVSKMANLKLKKMLHMCAMAAIRSDAELKAYYIRKVSEGKNKMSVLNAVRNKLVHRVMAVITRQTPYEKENWSFYQKETYDACILT